MTMPLQNGSVVKIWHGTRGHDYVVVAINRAQKKIGLIKHTCINNDGSIHGNTLRVNKWIPYEELGVQKIVPRITRVVGTREVDNSILRDFLIATGETRVIAVSTAHNVVASVDRVNDARLAAAL